ncbi:hypothetical protein [Enterococcus casseliflavus]|uniref:hypothetical protein n=2 Tax=Enterococcus casseliflavus TaxID=37734 RepID=UPI003D0CAD50
MILNESDTFVIEEIGTNNKIIKKQTILIPYSNRRVDVYVNEEEVLPPICDAILRLYQITSEFDFVQMGDLLGIDSLEVNNIYLSLIEKGLIDYVSHILTDEGRAYINRRKLVNRNKQTLTVAVNKITGEVDYQEEGAFINYQDKNKSALKFPYEYNEKIVIQDMITFEKMSKVWNFRKKVDEYKYKGELAEVLASPEKNTVYKKYNIYYYLNEQNELEIRAYERTRRDKDLEQYIWMQESSRPELTKEKYDHYFENVVKRKENTYSDYQKIDFELGVFDSFSFLNDAKENIQLFLPIHSFSIINEELLFYIKKVIDKGIKIDIYFNGLEWVSVQQRIYIYEVLSLRSLKNVNLFSSNKYCPQTIILDGIEGVILEPKIFEFSIGGTAGSSVMLVHNSLNEKQHKYIEEIIVKNSISEMNIPDTFSIAESCKDIVSKTDKLDELFSSKSENLTWFSQNDKREFDIFFANIKKVLKREKYESFTTNLSRKIVENFKSNSRRKGKNYFDSDFKEEYPDLSFAMNRVRVYRNSFSHEFLDKYFVKMSIDVISNDFNNYCPVGINNIYEFKQYKMISEYQFSLNKTIEELQNESESPF